MADRIEQRLLKLKQALEDARTRKAQAEGRLQSALESLSRDHGCESVAQAEKKLARLEKEIKTERDRLEKMLQELEEAPEWMSE